MLHTLCIFCEEVNVRTSHHVTGDREAQRWVHATCIATTEPGSLRAEGAEARVVAYWVAGADKKL